MWQSWLQQSLSAVGTAISNATGALVNTFVGISMHIYLIIVRQQVLIGFQMMTAGLLWICFAWLVYRLMHYVHNKKTVAKVDKEAILLVGIIVFFVSTLIGLNIIIAAIPHILNPEYYAIQDSANLIRSLR